jgi:hypothetical protein
MRFQRLLLESDGTTVNVDLHPRLTVVAGVGPLERESLVSELLGGLSSHRPGTHLEVVEHSGRRLGIMHPSAGGRDRVVELSTQQDVTVEFVDDAGTLDVLAAMGVERAAARRKCRMTAGDMAALAKVDGAVAALAAHDQDRLWAAATRVRETDTALRAEVAAIGGDPDDAPLVEEVERRHAAFEAAQARLEYVRHHGIFVGGASVLGAVPAVFLRSWVAFPLLATAMLTTILSIAYRRRLASARAAEQQALASAGAEDYLAFRLSRTQRLLDAGVDRSHLGMAVADHQRALGEWARFAGDVSVDWAFDMRDRILSTAARLREAGGPSEVSAAEPGDLAQALIERMTELRHIGARGSTLPLLLDEPLAGATLAVKTWMLELIARSAGSPQVVYLTDDPDVAAWARMESISGDLAVIEPAPANEPVHLTT